MHRTRLFLLGLALIVGSSAMAGVSKFQLPWMNSPSEVKIFDSSAHSDGIFVVEAWFNGCPYCHKNAPQVMELAEKYSNESRVHVLDVGVDRKDSDYESWIEKHQPKHAVLKDSNRVLIGQLGTSSYPSTYVIDCRGNVVAKTNGTWNASKKATIQKAIDNLLKQNCKAEESED